MNNWKLEDFDSLMEEFKQKRLDGPATFSHFERIGDTNMYIGYDSRGKEMMIAGEDFVNAHQERLTALKTNK